MGFDTSALVNGPAAFAAANGLGYAPQGYERDALCIMTPDLMALLIDETDDLDVEVVDDMLFVYATAPFDTRSAAVWERIGRIRDMVGAKAIRQAFGR